MTVAVSVDRSRRDRRERPYSVEHEASVARRIDDRPRTLQALLAWYREGWQTEVPPRVHVHSIDVGRPARVGQAARPALEGGSRLGSPAWADEFRRFIENTARETHDLDGEEVYVRPMRAALARMGSGSRVGLFMAGYLVAVARHGWSWRDAADAVGLHQDAAEPYLQLALERLWRLWQPGPPARIID